MKYDLIIVNHIYGHIQVEAQNKSKALEQGQLMSDDGVVAWKNHYESLYFAENEKPEFSPDYVWQLAREHSYFRKAIIDLKRFIEKLIEDRPNVLDGPGDHKNDHDSLTWLILNSQKINTRTISTDYEPKYDNVAELVSLLKVFVKYNFQEKVHYEQSTPEFRVNHIFTYVNEAMELIKNLENDKGEFLLLETVGGAKFTQTVKDIDGNPRCFTSRIEAENHGKQLQAPKVIRIR